MVILLILIAFFAGGAFGFLSCIISITGGRTDGMIQLIRYLRETDPNRTWEVITKKEGKQ